MIDEEQLDDTQKPNISSKEILEELTEDGLDEKDLSALIDSDPRFSTTARSVEVMDDLTPNKVGNTDSEAGASGAVVLELEQAIESLKAQIEDRTTQYMRIAADFENFRRRTQKEKEDLEQQIKSSTIIELLPVVDNFERARSHLKPQTEEGTTINKSYQSVYKQLVECLKRIGVSPMRSEGQEFDPNLHEAVMRESTDQHPEGTVMEELRRGYMLGDRVLRHAMVKVAAPPDSSGTAEELEQG